MLSTITALFNDVALMVYVGQDSDADTEAAMLKQSTSTCTGFMRENVCERERVLRAHASVSVYVKKVRIIIDFL